MNSVRAVWSICGCYCLLLPNGCGCRVCMFMSGVVLWFVLRVEESVHVPGCAWKFCEMSCSFLIYLLISCVMCWSSSSVLLSFNKLVILLISSLVSVRRLIQKAVSCVVSFKLNSLCVDLQACMKLSFFIGRFGVTHVVRPLGGICLSWHWVRNLI